MQMMATSPSAATRLRSRCRRVAIAAALGIVACNQASDLRPRPKEANQEASMVYPIRSVWAGASQIAESVTVVTSATAWDALRASWEAGLRAKIGEPAIAWDHELVLVLAGPQTNDHTVALTVPRLERSGDNVVVEVSFQGQAVDVWTPNHPTLVAVASQAALSSTPAFRLTWNGRPWAVAVRVER
jgi:hypothetical protein